MVAAALTSAVLIEDETSKMRKVWHIRLSLRKTTTARLDERGSLKAMKCVHKMIINIVNQPGY